ncbi:MAG: cytidine deaminase [Pseudomonadota bacterium]
MLDKLFEAASAAMKKSYSPYSQFPVGAAILAESGAIYSGCNIENAAYPQGWCAETSAISHMILGGDHSIREIAVIAQKKDLATPCGGCRQKLSEFGSADTKVHLCNQAGIAETVTLAELLPLAFDLEAS